MAGELTLDLLTEQTLPVGTDLVPLLRAAPLQKVKLSSLKAYLGTATGVAVISPSGETTGATDTAAIQAALNSGLIVQLAPGVFYTNATLTVQSYANCGQTLRGSGSYYNPASSGFSTTPPPGTTVIRPTAAVTTAMVIDGTPIGGVGLTWVQGFAVENLAIDMVNMADVPTTIGMRQIQAWDCSYSRVRVMNDGVNKRGWLFSAGAFVTRLDTCQSNWLEFTGASNAFGVTTITVINHDGNNVSLTYAGTTKFMGGTYQGSGTRFKLRNAFAVSIETDIEGTGFCYDLDNTCNAIWTRSELQGFSGTYMVGTPSNSSQFWDQQVNFQTYPANLSTGRIQLNNQGAVATSSFLSGANASTSDLRIGRLAQEAIFGISAGAASYISSDVAGDLVIETTTAGTNLWIAAAQFGSAKATSTGFNTFGTGNLNQGVITCASIASGIYASKPAADGQMFTLQNAAGTAWLVGGSNGAVGSSTFGIGNGANIEAFQTISSLWLSTSMPPTVTVPLAVYRSNPPSTAVSSSSTMSRPAQPFPLSQLPLPPIQLSTISVFIKRTGSRWSAHA